jgi:hypothetical protein
MWGAGICPFRGTDCTKTTCELWSEYEHQCSFNIIAKALRDLTNKREE